MPDHSRRATRLRLFLSTAVVTIMIPTFLWAEEYQTLPGSSVNLCWTKIENDRAAYAGKAVDVTCGNQPVNEFEYKGEFPPPKTVGIIHRQAPCYIDEKQKGGYYEKVDWSIASASRLNEWAREEAVDQNRYLRDHKFMDVTPLDVRGDRCDPCLAQCHGEVSFEEQKPNAWWWKAHHQKKPASAKGAALPSS